MELMAVYDTTEKVESKTTPDLLAQLILEYVPQSNSWLSMPDEDDPTGENWTAQWSDIDDAIGEIDRFLASEAADQMAVDDFTTDELKDELRLFCDELRSARRHTSKFHLCIY